MNTGGDQRQRQRGGHRYPDAIEENRDPEDISKDGQIAWNIVEIHTAVRLAFYLERGDQPYLFAQDSPRRDNDLDRIVLILLSVQGELILADRQRAKHGRLKQLLLVAVNNEVC